MSVNADIDAMIADLKRERRKPRYVVMGKKRCMAWLVEQAVGGNGLNLHDAKRYDFKHRGIPVVVCESDILEVVPDAKYLLG